MGAAFFLGTFIGNIVAGFLSDILGRKYTLFIGNSIEFVCFVYLYYA